MIRRILIIALFFAISIEAFLYTQPVKADAYVYIVSHSGFLGPGGGDKYWIVGEVKNIGTGAALHGIIEATLYDADYSFIAVEVGYTITELIMPNQKAPFIVTFDNSSQASKVSHYTLEVSIWNTTTHTRTEGLRILSQSHSIDESGMMTIIGEIQNTGTESATDTNIFATCYDSNGTVVYVTLSYKGPYEIPAGQKTTYEMIVQPDRAPLIDSLTLSSISDEYRCYEYPIVVIPEFPMFLILPLFVITTLLTIILRKKIRQNTPQFNGKI